MSPTAGTVVSMGPAHSSVKFTSVLGAENSSGGEGEDGKGRLGASSLLVFMGRTYLEFYAHFMF